jgi:acetylornithine/N-succinyldiaminopimelate aminotransferase
MFAIKENTNTGLHEVDQEYYLPTFKRFPLALERGEGCYVWDVEGKRYLDVLAGIAVNNLGHCHPKVVKAIQDQAAKLMHISNFFVSEPQVELSKMLVEKSGLDRVFFSNSGAESVEGAFKIARKYAHTKGRGSGIIAMQNSFHGRTLATIATGKAKMQKGFGPMPSGFHRVPFNDLEAVKALISKEIAAIILEPIQGEGGIRPADEQYIHDLRALCDKEDIVLIFDEIQCGIARTGKFLATEHYGLKPDIITLAKGLGSGIAVGAILSNEKVSQAIDFGDHGTTFGGNPMACAAGLATLQTIDEENIIQEAELKGQQLMTMLRNRLKGYQGFREVRDKGLMIGVEFDFETKPLVMEMMDRNVLANATSGNVLRLVPPLIINESEMNELVDVIEASLKAINQ